MCNDTLSAHVRVLWATNPGMYLNSQGGKYGGPESEYRKGAMGKLLTCTLGNLNYTQVPRG